MLPHVRGLCSLIFKTSFAHSRCFLWRTHIIFCQTRLRPQATVPRPPTSLRFAFLASYHHSPLYKFLIWFEMPFKRFPLMLLDCDIKDVSYKEIYQLLTQLLKNSDLIRVLCAWTVLNKHSSVPACNLEQNVPTSDVGLVGLHPAHHSLSYLFCFV